MIPFDARGFAAAEAVLENAVLEAEERSACECGSLLVGGVQKFCVRCGDPACARCLMTHRCPVVAR